MSAVVSAQTVRGKLAGAAVPLLFTQPMPLPQLDTRADLTPTQLNILNRVREDIRAVSSVQPIHRLLVGTASLPSIKNPAEAATTAAEQFFGVTPSETVDAFSDLHSSKIPLAVKALVAGAGLVMALLFASSNILPSPSNEFAAALIGFVALLSLPIISDEFTSRRLQKEFELIPLQSDNLPSLEDILDHGCTPEQFGAFVKEDLLGRVPIGYAGSVASTCGTCLHDVIFWGRDDLSFPSTTWKTVHKVIDSLGVGKDISLRVKAALTALENTQV